MAERLGGNLTPQGLHSIFKKCPILGFFGMRIFENSFHMCRFIDVSAYFTPHSDSGHLLNSEPLAGAVHLY
jgi:hypothetical protein